MESGRYFFRSGISFDHNSQIQENETKYSTGKKNHSFPSFDRDVQHDDRSRNYLQDYKSLIMFLTIILILAGLVCFALFFKSIDFFDKI